jgi:hypothetical protein
MADHLGSPPHDPRPTGWLTRARGHLVDVTPLKVSRDFRRLFIGRSISDFGDEIVAVVVPFQVYEITGSTLAVGLIGLVELVPVLVFPILGGAFADALERRRLTITTHAILAALSALMAVNAFLDEPLLWPLYGFAFISAGLYTFNRPGLDTWPARLLSRDLLPSANALEAGFGTLDSMLGPVAAGILLLTVAPGGAFAFDAVTFLIVIVQIARMRPSPPSDDDNEVSWEAIKDGFRFLKGKRTLQSVFLVDLNAMVSDSRSRCSRRSPNGSAATRSCSACSTRRPRPVRSWRRWCRDERRTCGARGARSWSRCSCGAPRSSCSGSRSRSGCRSRCWRWPAPATW